MLKGKDEWECKNCTFHNPAKTKVCEMCGDGGTDETSGDPKSKNGETQDANPMTAGLS